MLFKRRNYGSFTYFFKFCILYLFNIYSVSINIEIIPKSFQVKMWKMEGFREKLS